MIEKNLLNSDKYAKQLQPDWKNPPSIVDLKGDLREATSSHSVHVDQVNKWLEALNAKRKIKTIDGRSKVQPRLIRKQNEWRYAQLEEPFLSTDDMFKINPITYMDVDAARQNELILNKQFRVDIPRTKFINKYIRTAVDRGTVLVKVHWESEIGLTREERLEPIFLQSEEEALQYLMALVQNGQLPEEQAVQLMESGEWQQIPIGEKPVVEEVTKLIINRPVLEIKDTRAVIIDPSCEGNLDNARFIVDKFLSDLSTLTKDGRYQNLELIKESDFDDRVDAEYDSEYSSNQNFKFQDKARQKLIVYEYWGYWDIHDDGIVVPIVATWVGNVLIRLEENPYPDKKLPYVVVQYLPSNNDAIYGEADASLLIDNQDIIGAVTRGIIDLIGRSANAQVGIAKGLLDPLNKDKFTQGMNFEYNPIGRIDNLLFTTKMPEIPRSALELIQLQNNEAEALTGVKAFSAGITGNALGDQVGGIRSALDATAKRELSILRRLSDGLKEIAKKLIFLNSVYLQDEEIIRITDENFIAIKRDDLAGNFDLSVNVSTAEADNQKAGELAFMLQTLGNSVPFDIVKIIMIKIAELRKLPELARALKEYSPQPDPLQQAKVEAEIEYLKANTQKDISAVDKNVADAVLKEAKAGVENARNRKTHSEADRTDLDWLEQAQGLKQNRELEKIKIKEDIKNLNKQTKTATTG